MRRSLAALAAGAAGARAVTVYNQMPYGQMTASSATGTASAAGTGTASAASASYTGAAAYDPTVLNAPPLPQPMPSLQYSVGMAASNATVANISIPQAGSFFGFSVEFSVLNQVVGKNSTLLQVPFLNLMSNIVERAGAVHVRLGGNTQDTAAMVNATQDGKILEKNLAGITNPTETPPLVFTPDVLYMMSNVSRLTNVRWYLGIPFNDTQNLKLAIAEYGQEVLGDLLLGLQAGNEPDLYAAHGHRQSSYGPYDYFGEFGTLVSAIANDSLIPRKNNLLIAPSVSGTWTPEMIWDTNFIPTYASSIGMLAVERYPDNNCFATFNIGAPRDPQTVFPDFLNHTSGQLLVAPFLNSTAIAQQNGKPFVMFETNTASCGGFPGISDAFGAALWAADYALTMAYSNFSEALFHVGGQSDYYNPFTPPPTNQSGIHQWTVGPLYYSALAVAEAFGATNTSQIVDLGANYANEFTPAFGIYEHGQPARVVALNFMTDPSGASDSTLQIFLPQAPAQVTVKYLRAPSVSTKASSGNITWAGQTFGPTFGSDGRPMGELDVKTFPCDAGTNSCNVTVPAPSLALVFLSDSALSNSGGKTPAPSTFATSAVTKGKNTATIDPKALQTSNGMNGKSRLGSASTSKGGLKSAARRAAWAPATLASVCAAALAAAALL